MVITDLQNDFDYIQALVIQADGKIVAAGVSARFIRWPPLQMGT